MSSGSAAKAPPPIRRSSGSGAPAPRLRRGRALEPVDAEHRQFEEHHRGDQQIDRPERHRQADGDDRAKQRAGRAAGADEAEQPLALLGGEEVGHERPEHGDRKQIEHADPDEEHPRHDHRPKSSVSRSQNSARLAAKK